MVTSFIWTTVTLSLLVFFWLYQDIQSNWDIILGIQKEPQPAAELAFAFEVTATPTLWKGPPSSATPTETLIPSPTVTLVVAPPVLLPVTLNLDEPPPIPILVHTEEEINDYLPTPIPIEQIQAEPTATPTVAPIETSAAAPTTPLPGPPIAPTAPLIAPSSTPTRQPPTPTTQPPTPTATQAADTGETDEIDEIDEITPTRLVIPSVDIDATVIPVGWRLVEQNGKQYSIWGVADYAIGWHNTSARPGQAGNMVMAGHHNINGEVFRNLVNAEVGDDVVLYTGEQARRYKIELKTIVKEKGEPAEVRQRNAQWISPTTDERMTLVTCWPYTNNTHRVIVVAKPAG